MTLDSTDELQGRRDVMRLIMVAAAACRRLFREGRDARDAARQVDWLEEWHASIRASKS